MVDANNLLFPLETISRQHKNNSFLFIFTLTISYKS